MIETKLLLLSNKLILGLMLAAPIGPVSVEMIRRGLRAGFLSAFSIRLGGAIGNTLCLVGTYFGLSHIMGYPMLVNALGLAGAGLLIYMGLSAFLKKIDTVDLESESNVKNGLTFGLYLSVANPVALVFWPGLFAADLDPTSPLTMLGFTENLLIIAGVLLWGAGLSIVLDYGSRFINHKNILIINKISGLCMMYFGLKYLLEIGERLIG